MMPRDEMFDALNKVERVLKEAYDLLRQPRHWRRITRSPELRSKFDEFRQGRVEVGKVIEEIRDRMTRPQGGLT